MADGIKVIGWVKNLTVERGWEEGESRLFVSIISSIADGEVLTNVSLEVSGDSTGDGGGIILLPSIDKMACLQALHGAISETLEELEKIKILPSEE